MAFNFRDVEHKLCIALDPNIAKLLCPDAEYEANAIICYGYVDKQAGLTYEVLCLASYIDGDYTIVNENRTVGMKIRAEHYENTTIIPIKNAAILKRFEEKIKIIEDIYYSGDKIEEARKYGCIDDFRHPFYPDDVKAILLSGELNPEQIWVKLKRYIGSNDEAVFFEGELMNTPFESKYGLSAGDKVALAVVKNERGKQCFVLRQ